MIPDRIHMRMVVKLKLNILLELTFIHCLTLQHAPFLLIFIRFNLLIQIYGNLLFILQVKANYMCLTKVAANKSASASFKPIVAWMTYNDVSIENIIK